MSTADTLRPGAPLDPPAPAAPATVPSPRPCQARALVDALHRRDDADATVAAAIDALGGDTAALARALASHRAEARMRAARRCTGCRGTPLATGPRCLRCEIAAIEAQDARPG